MNKKLLLSFAVFAATFGVNAQKGLVKSQLNAQKVNSLYAQPQDASVSATSKKGEVRVDLSKKRGAVNVTDTMCIASAKWSLAQSNAKYYTIKLIENTAKKELTVLNALQSFPFVGKSTLKGFGLYAQGLNASGTTTIDVAILDGTGFVDQEQIVITNSAKAATAFYQFSKSYALTDTFKLIISSHDMGDSLNIITSGDVSKLGVNSFNGLIGAMVLDEANGYAVKSNNNYAIAADANKKGVDSDWQLYPIVDYSFENKTTADKYCLNADKTVTFSFSGNEDLLKNPIVNINSFFIKYAGQNKTQKRLLASAMYDGNEADTLDNLTGTFSFVKTFADEKYRNVKVSEVLKVWGYKSSYIFTSSTDLAIGLDAVATVANAKCAGDNLANIEITSMGGVAPFTGLTKEDVPAVAGTKSYDITDKNGCKATVVAAIKDAPAAIALDSASVMASNDKKNDGKAIVIAKGGTAPYAYTWVGNNETNDTILVGKGSYKVYVKDANDCATFATITVAAGTASVEALAISNLSIYPNPVAGELKVSFDAKSAATVELVNVAGQVIASKVANEFVTSFNTASLDAGVYFVNIKVAEGTYTQKIVKD